MPVRPRRQRRSRHALTLGRYMALSIGPRDDESLDDLRAVFSEHRRRFDDGDWAVRYFERGIDDRESTGGNDELPAGVGCPGLAG
jgi:hypothetical protein